MQELRRLGVARVEAGLFGAHMQSIHDGERSGHDPAGYEGLAAYRTLNDHTPDGKEEFHDDSLSAPGGCCRPTVTCSPMRRGQPR